MKFSDELGSKLMQNQPMIKLITIPISHYCEKARWALKWGEIPFVEEGHMQVFHFLPVYRAGGGDTTPVLVTAERVMTDSTEILHWVDETTSKKLSLYPAPENLKKEIEQFEDFLDEEFGVAGRLWMYTYMLDQMPTVLKYSKIYAVPKHETVFLPFIFPVIKRLMRKILNMNPSSREVSRLKLDQVLELVAQKLKDGRPFLFGDQFTAADLTFAALSAPLVMPENYGVPLPKLAELPLEMKVQIEKWRSHPAGQFALRLYKEHR